MRASTREGAGRALLVIASVGITVAGLEAAARVARRFRAAGYEANEVARYTEYDPLLGWHKRPHSSVTYHRREYSVEVAINHLGLRDRERDYAAPAGVCRILALGDSFVEGYTVPLAQTVGQVLEASLRRGGRRVDVLNAGTSGYSTDQEYLFYVAEGVRFSPHIILLFFYYNDVLYNDRDHFGKQPKPVFADHDGRLELTVQPVPPPPPVGHERRPLLHRGSALLEWLHDRLFYGAPRAEEALARLSLWEPIAKARAPMEIRVYDRRPPAELDAAWTKTADLLGALAREVTAHEAQLLVVYVPNRFEVDAHAWELTRIVYDVDDTVWDRRAVGRRLLRIGAVRGFPVLDLTETLRREVRWWSGPYFDYDGHWNATGHRAAANAVREFLERSAWLPSR
jgi:GDSL-like lipase/acylhydrolase family protein